MKQVEVYVVDAFTTVKGEGNPAGVVMHGDRYSTTEMQEIAARVGFNETVFILDSHIGDVKLRYFTPGHETPLCGHATMGAVHFLKEHGLIRQHVAIETQVGVLPVEAAADGTITMRQDIPSFIPFEQSTSQLCQVLGIEPLDLHAELPILYGNTGSWTLIVPVKEEAVLDRMQPDTAAFSTVLKELPKSSIHPFTLLSEEAHHCYARHFSSPYSGTVEDSVTGTASGVMGAYLQNHVYPKAQTVKITVDQGKHVKRPGTVEVLVERTDVQKVSITGKAVLHEAPLIITLEKDKS